MGNETIVLSRSVMESAFYKDPEYVFLWLHLHLSANHTAKNEKVDKSHTIVHILPGQLLTNRSKLAEQTGIESSKVQRILATLESEQQIEQQTFTKYRVITVTNWGAAQTSEQQNEQQTNSNRTAEVKEKPKKVAKILDNDLFSAENAANPVSTAFLTKKKKKLVGKRLETFEAFWSAFDYKRGKAEAADAWLEITTLTDTIVKEVITAAEAEASRRPEVIAQGHTPKMAQGWLTARRWEDEAPRAKVTGSNYLDTDEYMQRLKKAAGGSHAN